MPTTGGRLSELIFLELDRLSKLQHDLLSEPIRATGRMLTLRYHLALKAEALHLAGRTPEPLPRLDFYKLGNNGYQQT